MIATQREFQGSCTQLINEALTTWRAATTRQLSDLIVRRSKQSPALLKRSLNRLRRRGRIRTTKFGQDYINFSIEEVDRFHRLTKETPGDRQSYFIRSGLKHHLQSLDLYLQLSHELPKLEIYSNPLSFIAMHSKASGSYRSIRSAPDLALVGPWQNPSQLIYVEMERTQKSSQRYHNKWEAYEVDDVVSRVVYVVESGVLYYRLIQELRNYFRRSYGMSDFFIAVVTEDSLKSESLQGLCECFTPGKTDQFSLRAVLTEQVLFADKEKS